MEKRERGDSVRANGAVEGEEEDALHVCCGQVLGQREWRDRLYGKDGERSRNDIYGGGRRWG